MSIELSQYTVLPFFLSTLAAIRTFNAS